MASLGSRSARDVLAGPGPRRHTSCRRCTTSGSGWPPGVTEPEPGLASWTAGAAGGAASPHCRGYDPGGAADGWRCPVTASAYEAYRPMMCWRRAGCGTSRSMLPPRHVQRRRGPKATRWRHVRRRQVPVCSLPVNSSAQPGGWGCRCPTLGGRPFRNARVGAGSSKDEESYALADASWRATGVNHRDGDQAQGHRRLMGCREVRPVGSAGRLCCAAATWNCAVRAHRCPQSRRSRSRPAGLATRSAPILPAASLPAVVDGTAGQGLAPGSKARSRAPG